MDPRSWEINFALLRGARRRSAPMEIDATASTGLLLAWFTSQPGDVCDAPDGQSGPTGLMARAKSLAGFAVKIFVKEHKVAPVRVVDEARVAAVARTTPAGVGEEDAGEARAKFKSDLTEVHHPPRSGGAFDLEAVSIEMVVAFEGLEDKEVYREPDRPTPVRVAAKEAGSGFAGVIVDAVLDSAGIENIRIILVKLRNGAQPVWREEFIFVEHVFEHSFQSRARRDREQTVVMPRFTVADGLREIGAMFHEPL